MRRAERQRGVFSVFAWLPWECEPSVSAPGRFSRLHSVHHLLFLPHWRNLPTPWINWNLCIFLSSGTNRVDGQEVRAAGSYSPHATWLMPWVTLGDCKATSSAAGHCWLLPASACPAEWGSGEVCKQIPQGKLEDCDPHPAPRDKWGCACQLHLKHLNMYWRHPPHQII